MTDENAAGQDAAGATEPAEIPAETLAILDAAYENLAVHPKKPNVVWVLLDAARADHFSSYGYHRPTTPVIDALAARGVLFENNFTQAYATLYSLPSFMTGKYFPVFCQTRAGWRELWKTPPDDEMLVSSIFAGYGYATAMVSAHPGFARGSRLWNAFEFSQLVRPVEGNINQSYADLSELVRVFQEWLNDHKNQPFFLYLHSLDTHFPHIPTPETEHWVPPPYPGIEKLFNPVSGDQYNLDARDQAFLAGIYDDSLRFADAQVGKLLHVLDEAGVLKDTIIIISSDHGEALGENGHMIGHPERGDFDEVMHVPLIMSGPGIPRGQRVNTLTQNADIVPTLIDLANLETSANTDGKSLTGLLENPETAPVHDYVFYKFKCESDSQQPGIVLRTGAYKFVTIPCRNEEYLYEVPDMLTNRNNVLNDHPEIAAGFRQIIEQEILPLWKKYEELPLTSKAPFIEKIPTLGHPSDSYVSIAANSWSDDKWSLGGGLLWSAGWREDAPPISFDVEVPPGSYRVSMSIRSGRNHNGHPASAFLVKAETDEEFRTIIHDSQEDTGYVFVELGDYVITDGVFNVTLDEGDRQHWAQARDFRFVPQGIEEDGLSPEEQAEMDAQIRALGYVD